MINEEDVAAIWVSLDRLKEWKDNPRKNEEAVGPVAKSIKECGFGSPIVARLANGEIINGNTRYKASRDILKLDRVPVRFMDVTEEEAHELALRDNKTGEIAGWDNDLLSKINREHQNIDLSKVGFADSEIEIIMSDISEADVAWKVFDETIGDSAPKGKKVTCPHCFKEFEV